MLGKTEIPMMLFLVLSMLSGIGGYHLLQITGTIGGIAPAAAMEEERVPQYIPGSMPRGSAHR